MKSAFFQLTHHRSLTTKEVHDESRRKSGIEVPKPAGVPVGGSEVDNEGLPSIFLWKRVFGFLRYSIRGSLTL